MRFIRYNLLIILLNLSDSLAQSESDVNLVICFNDDCHVHNSSPCTGGENKPHDLQEEEEEGVKILPFQVPFCGDINPELKCDISCYEDSNCQTLGFDFNKFQCSCAAQVSDCFLIQSLLSKAY